MSFKEYIAEGIKYTLKEINENEFEVFLENTKLGTIDRITRKGRSYMKWIVEGVNGLRYRGTNFPSKEAAAIHMSETPNTFTDKI
jgi:metal-sulfur cluster biosynthetic enzyme